MKLIGLSLLSLSLFAQTAIYPNAVVTDGQLAVATNNIQTLITSQVSSTATSFSVVSATGMAANQIATIDSENVWICGVTGLTVSVGRSACPNIDGRGFDGTSAVAHPATGANCNFGSASGCVSEYVVAWHSNSKNKEIEAVEKHLFGENISAIDEGADPTGLTDSTAALQAGVTVAAAAGKCLYIVGATTAFSAASPGQFTPYYKITGSIRGAANGGTCIKMDANTTLQEQTGSANVISLTGSFNWVEGGSITWASTASSGCGIYGADVGSLQYNDNTILNTRAIGNITSQGGSGFCVVATTSGAYRSNFLNIQARGFTYGVTKTGVSSGIVANNGKITGEVDNNTYGVYLNYAGENEIDVVHNGNITAGVWLDHAVRNRIFLSGGESDGKFLIYNSSAAQNNVCYAEGVGGCSSYTTDNSNGLNQTVGDLAQFSTTTYTNGDTRFCAGGCFSTSNFPTPDFPQGFFQIAPPGSPSAFTSNLFLIPQIGNPTNRSNDYLSFNPYNYNVTTNPNGGHGLHVRLDNANTTGYVMEHDGALSVQALDNWIANGGTQFGVTGFYQTNPGFTNRTGFKLSAVNDSAVLTPQLLIDGDGGQQWLNPTTVASLGVCTGSINYLKRKAVQNLGTPTMGATVATGSTPGFAFCNGSGWVYW